MDEQSNSNSNSSSSSSGSMDEQSKSSRGSTESSNRNSNIAKVSEQSLPISQSSSWTILPPDRIELFEASSSSSSSEESTAAGQRPKAEDEQNNAECKLVNEDADTQAEDVSDGISIISDCESTGRISPHPFLREHLNELSYKFDAGHELPLLGNLPELHAGQELRERRHQAEGLQLNETAPQTQTQSQAPAQPTATAVVHSAGRLLPLFQTGLTAIFYVGVTLAVLAFIGRLRNPVWQVHDGEEPIADLDQRLLELELQNNLMRAEIDIMSKQLLYLSSLMSGQSGGQAHAHGHGPGQARKPKTFKAWPGNGDSVDPVDITKADLKRPYKCPDGKYVEIAAMCMEMKPHAESLVDEIGNAVNDVLQQSQAFHDFEKITERLGTLAGHEATPTPNVDGASDSSKAFHAHGPPLDNNNRYPNADASKERYKTKYHNGKRQEHKHDSKEHKHDSKEHKYQPKEHKYDSKERHNRKSKEQQHGRKQRHDDDDDDSSSGEWHERMMHHREHARQLNQQKRNNNWYIERGGSREQIRSSETRR